MDQNEDFSFSSWKWKALAFRREITFNCINVQMFCTWYLFIKRNSSSLDQLSKNRSLFFSGCIFVTILRHFVTTHLTAVYAALQLLISFSRFIFARFVLIYCFIFVRFVLIYF